jgi:gliding motility-associated-like protein
MIRFLPWCRLLLLLLAFPAIAQPIITGTTPARNQQNVSPNSSVSVDFNQPLQPSSASALRVFSNQRGGLRTGNSGTSAISANRLSFAPTYAFRPGETVQATVMRNAQSSSGSLLQPWVYQFTTATTGGSGIFTNQSNVPVGDHPYIVATADVDGDGDLDLLTPNFYGSTVSVRLNNGSAVFSGTTDIAVGSQPRGLVAVDLDGDGDLDFATSNYNANTMTVRLNNGAGGFSGGGDFAVGGRPQSITASDIDGDGDQDLLVSNETSSDISIRINNGNGVFSNAPDVPVTSFPFSLTVGDVDGDGDIDLLAGNYSSNTVSVKLNNGAGIFSGNTDVPVGASPRGVAVADVDNDGDLDMLAANASSNNVSVRLNNGTGIFSGTNNIAVGSFPGSVITADVDSDGDQDLITTNIVSNTVSIRINNGAGGFSGTTNVAVGNEPYRVAAADLDGDGDLDLLAANFSGNNVSILINQPPPPRVLIVGDSVLCNGGQTQLTARGPLPIVAYRWSTGATTTSITVSQPGTYSVSVTFNEGTISTDQHVVTAITPTVRITGDSVVCSGQASLMAISPGARSYRWSNGATTAGISVAQPGTYTVTAFFGTGCAVTARVVVRIPALLITGNPVLCNTAGAATLLTAVPTPGASIRWNTGATTTALSVTQAGTYTATATFSNGCTLTASQVVSAAVVIPTFSLGADTTLCEGSALVLRAPVSQSGVTYRWSDGTTAPALLVTQAGTYSLQLIGNCESRTVSRHVDYRNCLLIPNVVTANNDGQNDQFKIQGLTGGNWALQVYDRWGHQVYTTTAYQNNWGSQSAAGMYYYLLQRNDTGTNYKGWVEVLR